MECWDLYLTTAPLTLALWIGQCRGTEKTEVDTSQAAEWMEVWPNQDRLVQRFILPTIMYKETKLLQLCMVTWAFSGPSISAPLGDMEWRLCIWMYHQSLQIKIVTCNDSKYITSGHIKSKQKVHFFKNKVLCFWSPRHSLNSVVGLIWVVNISLSLQRGGESAWMVWWRRVVDRCWPFGEHPEKHS